MSRDDSSNMHTLTDPFVPVREGEGVIGIDVNGTEVPLILGYRAVRTAAKDWQTFSSDAPFRVPVPSEEAVRSVRQLPIETDPPFHREVRKLLEPIFRRPQSKEFVERIDHLVLELLEQAYQDERTEVVRGFALTLQSRALAMLLRMPDEEAKIWIGWGTHVFHDAEGDGGGDAVERYLRAQLERAASNANGQDFFCELERMELNGRPLTFDEKLGIANLTFAGGRDTVINAVAEIIAHFAADPDPIRLAGENQKSINLATEEFVRTISPLTFIGRVCPHETAVGPKTVPADSQIGLCWASANFDPAVFDEPTKINLSRSPNPHVGFGSGHHACLGAHQARAILRSLIKNLGATAQSIAVIDAERNVERHSSFERALGYRKLLCEFRQGESA